MLERFFYLSRARNNVHIVTMRTVYDDHITPCRIERIRTLCGKRSACGRYVRASLFGFAHHLYLLLNGAIAMNDAEPAKFA